jgi:hypothetical protein
LHKVCPGLHLEFIFGSHTYDQRCRGVDLDELKENIRGSLTDATIAEAAGNVLTFEASGKTVTTEPAIKSYTQKNMTGGTKMTSAKYQA